MQLPHISVCICTYRRTGMLLALLKALETQEHDNCFSYSVVVADNDPNQSAGPVVVAFCRRSPLEIVYCAQPERNIALTRNVSLAHARGDLIAFIDDDECPEPDWLLRLFETLESENAVAALGPVRPRYDSPPPDWVVKGRFCERPEFPTGTAISWEGCRTGNVILRRSALPVDGPAFRAEFGTGGEDIDLFMRLAATGHRFVWCNEAPVYEAVPPSRLTRKYLLHRALLRGKNSLRISSGRAENILKSLVAVPAYSLLLPLAFLRGQARFMDVLIRLCDHSGRLFALAKLNPIAERQM